MPSLINLGLPGEIEKRGGKKEGAEPPQILPVSLSGPLLTVTLQLCWACKPGTRLFRLHLFFFNVTSQSFSLFLIRRAKKGKENKRRGDPAQSPPSHFPSLFLVFFSFLLSLDYCIVLSQFKLPPPPLHDILRETKVPPFSASFFSPSAFFCLELSLVFPVRGVYLPISSCSFLCWLITWRENSCTPAPPRLVRFVAL